MKFFHLFFILLLAASACSTVRQLPVTDSTKVEVRTNTVTIHDTAWVQLPVIVEKIQTLDTLSVLENKYAKSEALVSAGVLHHSLRTKPVREPVTVENQIVYRDSIVYRDRIVREDVYIEKDLTPWQRFRLRLGTWAFWALILAVVVATLYFVSPLKSLKP